MVDYTKGKWKYMGTHIYVDTPERGKGIARSIATIAEYNYDDESRANMYLISSAPIGDELAKAVLNMDYEDYDDFLAVLAIARRFKTKAEGK